MKNDCHNLDAYLGDDLSAGDAARFNEHLVHCGACRDAVDEQRWIDQILRSSEIAHIEPAPAALHETFLTSVARRRQKTRLIARSLAAAAAVAIVAAGWTLKLNRQAMLVREPAAGNVASYADLTNPDSNNVAPTRATFVSNGDTIAVPLESADDNVTIVQLYPTTEAERQMRRELALQLIDSETNGG